MKKAILFILLLTILSVVAVSLTSCGHESLNEAKRENSLELIPNEDKITLERLMPEVEHGLYKVKLDDSTTVLIYRGVESCTMIQLK